MGRGTAYWSTFALQDPQSGRRESAAPISCLLTSTRAPRRLLVHTSTSICMYPHARQMNGKKLQIFFFKANTVGIHVYIKLGKPSVEEHQADFGMPETFKLNIKGWTLALNTIRRKAAGKSMMSERLERHRILGRHQGEQEGIRDTGQEKWSKWLRRTWGPVEGADSSSHVGSVPEVCGCHRRDFKVRAMEGHFPLWIRKPQTIASQVRSQWSRLMALGSAGTGKGCPWAMSSDLFAFGLTVGYWGCLLRVVCPYIFLNIILEFNSWIWGLFFFQAVLGSSLNTSSAWLSLVSRDIK